MNLVDRESALKTLKNGLPIIFPTDTLPAIGCLPEFSNILYEFKKNRPTPQSLKRATTLTGICRGIDEEGRLLLETPQQTCAVLAGSLTDPSAIWTQ